MFKIAEKASGRRFVHTALRSLTCRAGSILSTVRTSSNVGLGALEISKNTIGGGFLVRFRSSVLRIPIREPAVGRAATLNTTCLTKLTIKF